MFNVPADGFVATISELRKDTKKTLAASHDGPVYVFSDGKPIAAVVSLEMMELVTEAMENSRLGRVAGERLEAIRSGNRPLLSEEEFWAKVEAKRVKRIRN